MFKYNTLDEVALRRAFAIEDAWLASHEVLSDDVVEYDIARMDRLRALLVRVYNTTCARIVREAGQSPDEDSNLDRIVLILARMGHEPARAEFPGEYLRFPDLAR